MADEYSKFLDDELAGLLLAGVGRIPGVRVSTSRWSGVPAIYKARKEIAHFHTPRVLDLRLTRKGQKTNKSLLQQLPKVTQRRNRSDWVEVTFQSAEDIAVLLRLIESAASMNA